jgi:hypothetical protein
LEDRHMNPARSEMTGPQKSRDSRRFWIVTISVAAVVAVIALVFFLIHQWPAGVNIIVQESTSAATPSPNSARVAGSGTKSSMKLTFQDHGNGAETIKSLVPVGSVIGSIWPEGYECVSVPSRPINSSSKNLRRRILQLQDNAAARDSEGRRDREWIWRRQFDESSQRPSAPSDRSAGCHEEV